MRLTISVPTAARLLPAAIAAMLAMPCSPAHAEKPRKPTPVLPAAQYAQHQTIGRVTVAIEPGLTKETRPDTRLDYFDSEMLPVRVIVTNDGDAPLTLDDARIHLIAADGTSIPAATLDDLQRRLFTLRSATGSKVPLPLPIPIPLTVGKKNIDKKIVDDDHDFGFATTTVEPHATVAGYLYYDVQDLPGATRDEPLAHTAMELRRVHFINPATAIDSFEIPLVPPASAAKKP